jgi:hypothetical protein
MAIIGSRPVWNVTSPQDLYKEVWFLIGFYLIFLELAKIQMFFIANRFHDIFEWQMLPTLFVQLLTILLKRITDRIYQCQWTGYGLPYWSRTNYRQFANTNLLYFSVNNSDWHLCSVYVTSPRGLYKEVWFLMGFYLISFNKQNITCN